MLIIAFSITCGTIASSMTPVTFSGAITQVTTLLNAIVSGHTLAIAIAAYARAITTLTNRAA